MKGNITTEQVQNVRAHIGVWIKVRREESELSQSELARQMGIAPETVNKIEAGKWGITIDMLELFCIHFGGSIKDFFLI